MCGDMCWAAQLHPVGAMRGDAGASTMYVRDLKAKLKYIKYIFNDGSDVLQTALYDICDTNCCKYSKLLMSYMREAGIANLTQLKDMRERELLSKIDDLERNMWLEELDGKSTLSLYSTHKRILGEEKFMTTLMSQV